MAPNYYKFNWRQVQQIMPQHLWICSAKKDLSLICFGEDISILSALMKTVINNIISEKSQYQWCGKLHERKEIKPTDLKIKKKSNNKFYELISWYIIPHIKIR